MSVLTVFLSLGSSLVSSIKAGPLVYLKWAAIAAVLGGGTYGAYTLYTKIDTAATVRTQAAADLQTLRDRLAAQAITQQALRDAKAATKLLAEQDNVSSANLSKALEESHVTEAKAQVNLEQARRTESAADPGTKPAAKTPIPDAVLSVLDDGGWRYDPATAAGRVRK